MKNKNRNYMIDNLKVILIFSVVFGHVIEYYIKDSNVLRGIYIFIYIFHMPLFVFISGYLSKNVNKCQKGAFKNLLVPYIFFNMLWYTVVYIGTRDFRFSLIYPGWTLWYLISLFFWRISLKYLIKIRFIVVISFIAGLVIGIIPQGGTILSFSRTITFLPFFLLGYFIEEDNLKNIRKFSRVLSIMGICSFIAIAFYISINNMIDYKFLYNSISYYNAGLNLVQGVLFRGLLYIGACTLSICVINLAPRKKTFFTHVGKHTMNIYVFHIYLILVVFFIVPNWNIGIFRKIFLFSSPIFITYLLSLKIIKILYEGIFTSINELLYEKLVNIIRKRRVSCKDEKET